MQKMQARVLQEFRNEYEMTCAAQNGNGRAWLILYDHYKNMMMSQLIAVKGLSREELESEALDVFAHELARFNREKVSSEDAYSMFSWLWCKILNRTNKLIRQRKKDVHLYFENVNSLSDRDGNWSKFVPLNAENCEEDLITMQNQMMGINDEIYNTYSPEKLVIRDLHEDDTSRVKTFYAKLTQFDKDILAARRAGLTLAQVANQFCCSVTTIKNHIQKAKQHADDVFQVCYA